VKGMRDVDGKGFGGKDQIQGLLLVGSFGLGRGVKGGEEWFGKLPLVNWIL